MATLLPADQREKQDVVILWVAVAALEVFVRHRSCPGAGTFFSGVAAEIVAGADSVGSIVGVAHCFQPFVCVQATKEASQRFNVGGMLFVDWLRCSGPLQAQGLFNLNGPRTPNSGP